MGKLTLEGAGQIWMTSESVGLIELTSEGRGHGPEQGSRVPLRPHHVPPARAGCPGSISSVIIYKLGFNQITIRAL